VNVALEDGSLTDCSATVVVTAAHCLDRASFVKVFWGGTDRWDMQSQMAANFTMHPSAFYTGSELQLGYDVGVVTMYPPIRLNGCTQAIHLNQGYLPTYAFFSGWGTAVDPFSTANTAHLKWAKVEVMGSWNEECHLQLGRHRRVPGQFCAGHENEFGDVVGHCNGDDGGPLAYRHPVHGWRLAGIASLPACGLWARGDLPGVFTDVAYFRDWILSQFPGAEPESSGAFVSSGAFACLARTTFLVSVLFSVWDYVL